MKTRLVTAIAGALLFFACAPKPADESVGTEESDLTQVNACAEATPARGSFELTNVSPAVQRIFEVWRMRARAEDERVAYESYKLRVEKIIRQTPDRVVFQVARADYTWAGNYRGQPIVHSWVVFFDVPTGTYRWMSGRYEVPVGESLVINLSAESAHPHNYGAYLQEVMQRFALVAANGEVIAYESFSPKPEFRRVAEDVVLAMGQPSNGGFQVFAIRPDAIVNATMRTHPWLSIPPEQEPCTGYRGNPWGR